MEHPMGKKNQTAFDSMSKQNISRHEVSQYFGLKKLPEKKHDASLNRGLYLEHSLPVPSIMPVMIRNRIGTP